MAERWEVKALLMACLTLIDVWDAGEEGNEIEWEDLADAVEQAAEAVVIYVNRA